MSCICALQICGLACWGCLYGTAWLVSPSFRKKCREDSERQKAELQELGEMADKALATIRNNINAIDSRMKKMEEILEKDDKLRENVAMMVESGFNKYESFRECYILMNDDKIKRRSKELMSQGIPRYQAQCIAEGELFN